MPVEIAPGVTKLLVDCARLKSRAALRMQDAQVQRIRAVAANIDEDGDRRLCEWAFSVGGSCQNRGSWIRLGRLATDRPRILCSEHYREAEKSRDQNGGGRLHPMQTAFALMLE